MRKGYIRPSKSPQTAPVFFVEKKDRKKRIVQDYRYLNEWMVKNNYLLPLIPDIVEMSYASLLVQKLHPCSGDTSKIYKLAFYGGHLSCNMSYGSAVTIWVFCLP